MSLRCHKTLLVSIVAIRPHLFITNKLDFYCLMRVVNAKTVQMGLEIIIRKDKEPFHVELKYDIPTDISED